MIYDDNQKQNPWGTDRHNNIFIEHIHTHAPKHLEIHVSHTF